MDKLAPKLSVLMSVYNDSRYLQESIESILNQSFTDFEFIIIDDGSSDNSWTILTEYAKLDQRIRLFKNEKNIGLTKSLNKGLKVCKGEYFARQDADDISLPERLKIQTDFLDLHPEVGVLGSNAKAIDEEGQFLRELLVSIEDESLQAYLLVNNCLYHSSLMARRRLVQAIEGYDEKLRYAQDYKLWWQLSNLSRLVSLPDVLIIVRKSRENITSKNRLEQLQCALKISLQAVEESLEDKSLDKEAYQRFWWAYHGRYGQLTSKDIQRLQPLWNLLANYPGAAQVWGVRFQKVAFHLLRRWQILEGLQLLWISAHRLKIPIQWNIAIRALVKHMKTELVKKKNVKLLVEKKYESTST